MTIKMFNGWYFVWLGICIGSVILLYFALKNRSQKTQKIVLFSLLVLGVVLHFLKFLIPPYSLDEGRLLRDSWFINICGANIFLFPFIFLSKSKKAKDYMFYIGLISGLIAIFVPLEPIQKVNQSAEILDIARFYYHHTILWAVPFLMVKFKIHTLDYKRVLWVPVYFLIVMLFVILNQIFQSELGFIDLRSDDFYNINYKNSSLIWGPGDEGFVKILTYMCPNCFKFVPVGEFAGTFKYWPWFWLIVPCFVYVTPLCFAISMIWDGKHFAKDFSKFKIRIKQLFDRKKD